MKIELEFGPFTSMVVGPAEFKVFLEEEKILNVEPGIGFLHRGLEKIAERSTWTGFVPYMDRLDYVSPIHSSLAYVLAVEKIQQTEVPDRAKIIRILVSELSRVSSHFYYFHQFAKSLGLETVAQFSLRERERINNLFEILCGARVTYNYVRVGGVAADVTEGFADKTIRALREIKMRREEFDSLFFNNPISKGRLAGIGRFTAKEALLHGLTGPNLRACGVAFDARKHVNDARADMKYDKLSFDILFNDAEVITDSGTGSSDAYTRSRYRFLEIFESIRIVEQCLEILPPGKHFVSVPRVLKPGKGEAFAVVESPRGYFSAFVKSEGQRSPYRVKFRTPSFFALSFARKLLVQEEVSNLAPVLNSLDIVMSEVDR